jgi:hypothetical protein
LTSHSRGLLHRNEPILVYLVLVARSSRGKTWSCIVCCCWILHIHEVSILMVWIQHTLAIQSNQKPKTLHFHKITGQNIKWTHRLLHMLDRRVKRKIVQIPQSKTRDWISDHSQCSCIHNTDFSFATF